MSALEATAALVGLAYKWGFWFLVARLAFEFLRMPLDLFLEALESNRKNIPSRPSNFANWALLIGLFSLSGCASKEVGFYPPYAQLPASANDYETPTIKPIHCDGFQSK